MMDRNTRESKKIRSHRDRVPRHLARCGGRVAGGTAGPEPRSLVRREPEPPPEGPRPRRGRLHGPHRQRPGLNNIALAVIFASRRKAAGHRKRITPGPGNGPCAGPWPPDGAGIRPERRRAATSGDRDGPEKRVWESPCRRSQCGTRSMDPGRRGRGKNRCSIWSRAQSRRRRVDRVQSLKSRSRTIIWQANTRFAFPEMAGRATQRHIVGWVRTAEP